MGFTSNHIVTSSTPNNAYMVSKTRNPLAPPTAQKMGGVSSGQPGRGLATTKLEAPSAVSHGRAYSSVHDRERRRDGEEGRPRRSPLGG